MYKIHSLILGLALAAMAPASVLSADAAEKRDAVMTNPVIWADAPDPDVIRVGDDYYMVTTTMHLMPGAPVMHSKDLVNWETISYIFDTLEDTPAYHMEGGTVYGKGQWATSLRYHDGKFYALFSPNDHPYKSYIYTATDPRGPWTVHSRMRHFHDSSFLFDDDGRVYVYSGSGNIHLTELEPDLSDVKKGGIDQDIIIPDEESRGLHEGTRVVKHNGKYYAMVINWPQTGRRQLCYRADKITGPYEKMTVLKDNFAGFPNLAQGCIVDGKDGDWWAVIFQDRGAVGRVLTLSPVKWIDGWPMVGTDGEGKVPLNVPYKKESDIPTALVNSDGFDSPTLGINWQWNHCPDNSSWSLTERPGYLRLRTSRIAGSVYDAPNTISQRMEGPCCDASVRLDLSGMKEGDVAGFGAFNGHSALLSVRYENGKKYLVRHNAVVNFQKDSKIIASVDDEEEERLELPGDEVYLLINADFRRGRDVASCQWSADGKNWNNIGRDYRMRYDFTRLFMGQRYAIYNYATRTPGGYIDVDSFDYHRYE